MKRILIFSLNYHPRFIGGAEVAIKEITDRIPPEDVEFHMVTLRFDSRLPKVEQVGNLLVHRIGFARKDASIADLRKFPLHLNKHMYQILAVWKAIRLHRKYHYDGIWAMMAHAAGIPAGIFKRLYPRTGYLLTLQEGDPPQHIERMMRPLWPFFKNAFTAADELQTISSFLLTWGKRRGFRGQGEVVPNGVDVERFAQTWTAEEVRYVEEKLGKKPGDAFLVTTSRLVHKNGVDTVIAALAHLPANVHFLIFGIGPLENALKAKAAALKIEKRVHFMGEIGHEELPYALAACDIFVRPSRSEGMGNSFIEAMAAGLPVIATQEGGIADFLFDARRNPGVEPTGWAVDADAPNEIAAAVEDILAQPEKVKRTVENASKLAREKYDWSPIAARMRELFGKVTAGSDTARLLIATPLYPPEPGGPATYTKLLEDGLQSQGVSTETLKFSDVRHLPKVLRYLSYFWRALRAGRRSDAVLALDPVSTGLPAAAAAVLLRKPFVVKVVGDYAWEQGTQRFGIVAPLDEFICMGRVPFPVAVLRSAQTWVACRAKLVIVPSEYLKGIVCAWGIPQEKVRVVHNAVQMHGGGSAPEAVRTLPHPFVVSVGRLVPWKGMKELIDAVAAVRLAGTPLSITVVGEGPERTVLEAHAQKMLGNGFTFTGALAPKDVHAVLAEADLFALNTSYEGLSHVLIEALMAGLPIVTTCVGGNPEVIEEGGGILVETGDTLALTLALRQLVEDKVLRDRMSIAARERAQAFSVDATLSRTKDVLSEIL